MTIKIEPFHVWLRRFPRNQWEEIRINIYELGILPNESQDLWRFVRLVSGKSAKLGVVDAEKVPEVSEGELLWLNSCSRKGNPEFHMRTTSGGGGSQKVVVRYYCNDSSFSTWLPEGLPPHNSPAYPRTPQKHRKS